MYKTKLKFKEAVRNGIQLQKPELEIYRYPNGVQGEVVKHRQLILCWCFKWPQFWRAKGLLL